MLWRKGTWEIFFTQAFSLLSGPFSMHYWLLPECLSEMCFSRHVILFLFHEIHERERAAARLSFKYIFTITFWYSSAPLPSLRHPTLLHQEPIRRPLLINQAQRRYVDNLMIVSPSTKWIKMYYWDISLLCPHFVASVICLDVAVGVLEDLSRKIRHYKNILKPCQCPLWPVHSALPCWQELFFSNTNCLQWWLEISSYILSTHAQAQNSPPL